MLGMLEKASVHRNKLDLAREGMHVPGSRHARCQDSGIKGRA